MTGDHISHPSRIYSFPPGSNLQPPTKLSELGLAASEERLRSLSKSNGPLLIDGAPGVGKSFLARWIHEVSPRSEKPCLRRGCGEFDYGTFARTIFGTDEDAGLLDLARGGTLILDDVDYLPFPAQQALVRFCEDQAYHRVGKYGETQVARLFLIVTTNKSLEKMVKEGRFSSDLLNRLTCWRFEVPTLAQRPHATEQLIDTLRKAVGHHRQMTQIPRFEPGLIGWLVLRPWPGNLHELRDTIENILHFGEVKNGMISLSAVQQVLATTSFEELVDAQTANQSSKNDDEEIYNCLINTDWNISLTARLLRKSRTTIHARVRQKGWSR